VQVKDASAGAQASAPVRPKADGSANSPNTITKLTVDTNVAPANRIPTRIAGLRWDDG
jgi:hypothetical protein